MLDISNDFFTPHFHSFFLFSCSSVQPFLIFLLLLISGVVNFFRKYLQINPLILYLVCVKLRKKEEDEMKMMKKNKRKNEKCYLFICAQLILFHFPLSSIQFISLTIVLYIVIVHPLLFFLFCFILSFGFCLEGNKKSVNAKRTYKITCGHLEGK